VTTVRRSPAGSDRAVSWDRVAAEPESIPLFRPEHDELRRSVRAFVSKEMAPHAETWERAESFPKELFGRAGELVTSG
jgi:hypothetical protein